MGIRGQLTLLVPGIVALALAAMSIFEARREEAELLEDFRFRNVKVLESIGLTTAVQIAQNDLSGLDTLIAHLSTSLGEREMSLRARDTL